MTPTIAPLYRTAQATLGCAHFPSGTYVEELDIESRKSRKVPGRLDGWAVGGGRLTP